MRWATDNRRGRAKHAREVALAARRAALRRLLKRVRAETIRRCVAEFEQRVIYGVGASPPRSFDGLRPIRSVGGKETAVA